MLKAILMWCTATFVVAGSLYFAAVNSAVPVPAPKAEAAVRILVTGGLGSGVHLGNGYVLTAAHVVEDNKTVRVRTSMEPLAAGQEDFTSGEPTIGHIADVLWVNQRYDFALIRLRDGSEGIAAAALDCRQPVVGEPIESVGNPFGIEFIHTWGKVAGGIRHFGDLDSVFIADLTVGPGMSGGPVFDKDGKVLGLNDAVVNTGGPMGGKALFPLSFITPALNACNLMGNA